MVFGKHEGLVRHFLFGNLWKKRFHRHGILIRVWLRLYTYIVGVYIPLYLMARPHFFYDGHLEVRAAGILVYVRQGGDIQFLMRKEKGKWSETGGGKSEKVDTCILDTAVRECVEETNGRLFSDEDSFSECDSKLREMITPRTYKIYSPRSKYMLFVVEADMKLRREKMTRFGNVEMHTRIRHYYKWVRKGRTRSLRLHPRLYVSGILQHVIQDLSTGNRIVLTDQDGNAVD